MLYLSDKKEFVGIEFNDIFIFEKWSKKIMVELKHVEKELCPCKYKIVQIKANTLIYWFADLWGSARRENHISYDATVTAVATAVKNYEDIIYNDSTISKKMYGIFRELHKVTTDEFVSGCRERILLFNSKEMDLFEFLDAIGEIMFSVFLNVIFEIHEIMIRCDSDCPISKANVNKLNVKFLMNNLYNLNSYSIIKYDKFVEILEYDTKELGFIADFKYMADVSLNPNVVEMLHKAKSEFKSLKIINANKYIEAKLANYFPEQIF